MDIIVNKFLDNIKLDSSYYGLFENASFISACYDHKTKLYNLTLKLDSLVAPEIYDKLLYNKKGILAYQLNIVLAHQPNLDMLKLYYKYIVQKVFRDGTFFNDVYNLDLKLEDNLVITCTNEIVYNAASNLRTKISTFFGMIGIHYGISLELVQDTAQKEAIALETEKAPQNYVQQDQSQKVQFTKNNDYFKKGYTQLEIGEITEDDDRVETKGRVFDVEVTENKKRKTNKYNIYITDDSNSILVVARECKTITEDTLKKISKGDHVVVKGGMQYNSYIGRYQFVAQQIETYECNDERVDNYEKGKRVELHLHTKMSNMDGVTDIGDYVKQAIKWGHKAIAVTDHGCVQAFPEAQKAVAGKDIKMIYGLEGYVVKNKAIPVFNGHGQFLKTASYVTFDLETTGLSTHYDRITEVALTKFVNGQVVANYDKLVNPLMDIPQLIQDKTHITNDMVLSEPTIDELLPEILQFIGDAVLVAHNGTFDFGMLNAALLRNGYSELTNTLIDTVALAQCLYPDYKRFSLEAVCKHMGIVYDTEDAHRADYDTNCLTQAFSNMLIKAEESNCRTVDDLNSLSPKDFYKIERAPSHTTFLVKNAVGLKNLFKMVSMSYIDYVTNIPLIPYDRIQEFREGLLVGSACFNNELFEIAKTRTIKELREAMKFYDYIEIQPLENYSWLLEAKEILSEDRLITILKDIINTARELGKLVVATGDCHYLNPRDKIFRDVYVVAKQVGAGFHPLNKFGVKKSPEQHFKTTQEMIDGLNFLNDLALQEEMVITNTNYIADQIEEVIPVKPQLFTPHFEDIDIDKFIRDLCNENAHKLYGENLPQLVEERMNKELSGIIDNGYGVIYYLAYRLVKKSNEDGYLVGSRGSVGSSFVASLMKITEVNPLPPHYLCPNCHHSEFITDGSVRSGFDLDAKVCPECGTLMNSNGQNIPFETFLGIKADKVPDIDLNFSRDYQATAHNYTKVLCGESNVFRAGTIGTVAEKTAYGHAKHYFEENQLPMPGDAELRRIAQGCQDVKRTTGQHPAGIIVVPNDMDIYDFTPIQYPADDKDSAWKTTHFKFEAIHDEILKLDILGHLDPMMLRMLRDITGVDPETIPLNDPKVLSLFTSLDELNVSEADVLNTIGSTGLPEFGTQFVKGVLIESQPKKFSDLVQISGLTHGTDVWADNAQTLIKSGEHSLMDVIGCRDDIMSDLIIFGMEKKQAFDIMEFVRKGKASKDPEKWAKLSQIMRENNVPEWYIDSCSKIKYMFPKAHAVAYVVMALRVAYFKVHYPLHYYAAYFSIRCDQFDIATMIKGHGAILEKVKELKQKIANKQAGVTDEDLFQTLESALEMTARGYKFSNLSISKSDSTKFTIDEETNTLVPPFKSIPGLGDTVAETIIKARQERPFTSKKDLLLRTQINKNGIQFLEDNGCLSELKEDEQQSFDLFG